MTPLTDQARRAASLSCGERARLILELAEALEELTADRDRLAAALSDLVAAHEAAGPHRSAAVADALNAADGALAAAGT